MFGGATSGHEWREDEFIERNRRIDINRLLQAGALVPGATTAWRWESGAVVYVRATRGRIFLIGRCVQIVHLGYLEQIKDRCIRPRFFCPACGRGCYHLSDKAGSFACHRCNAYDWKIRHRLRYRRRSEEKADG